MDHSTQHTGSMTSVVPLQAMYEQAPDAHLWPGDAAHRRLVTAFDQLVKLPWRTDQIEQQEAADLWRDAFAMKKHPDAFRAAVRDLYRWHWATETLSAPEAAERWKAIHDALGGARKAIITNTPRYAAISREALETAVHQMQVDLPAFDEDKAPSKHPPCGYVHMSNGVFKLPVFLDEKGEVVPDANPKTRYGLAKPGLSTTPPTALLYLGRVHDLGASKYGAFNWREAGVSASVYYNAAIRHLFQFFEGHDNDEESGLPHLAHVMACCGIVLDAKEQGKLNDDRPTPGKTVEVLKALTKPMEAKS